MAEHDFPNKLDWCLAAVAAATLLTSVDRKPQVEAQPLTPPTPEVIGRPHEAYPTMIPSDQLSLAVRRWCQDITVNGRRENFDERCK